MNNIISSFSDIIKNDLDTNKYEYVVLQNNLKFLLISDVKADKSACSLAVNVGSFDEKINGLAHFLEHLLFMGTKKYPDENAYMDFLNLNNGSSNAFTADECTVYYFDVSNNYLEQAIDMFAQFFISPLFNGDSVDREMSAVNSEFLSNVENENSRMYRVLQLCFNNNTRESQFSIGNTETLKIKNIREHVIELYEKKYCAEKMIGVLYSNKSIEEMTEMVTVFNLIKGKKNYTKIGDFCNNTNKESVEEIKTLNKQSQEESINNCNLIKSKKLSDLKDFEILNFFYQRFLMYISEVQQLNVLPTRKFIFQDIFKKHCKNIILNYRSLEKLKKLTIFIKTCSSLLNPLLFTHIIDQFNLEDIGCISQLKDKNLAYDTSINIDNISWYGLLCIEIFPTENGVNNLKEILNVVYFYFKNFNSWNFENLINRNKLNFTYKEKEDAIDVVEELSERLLSVPVKNILNFEYSNSLPEEELIKKVYYSLINRDEWIVLYGSDDYRSKYSDGVFGIEVDSILVSDSGVY